MQKLLGNRRGGSTRDMTSGPIVKQIILFALPLMLGNIFQMLYNTVDSIVVGNYVSTNALAAVNSTTMIANMLVFFFNGFATGAGVVIGQYFGAKEHDLLHTAVQTTIAMTFVLCVIFTAIGMGLVEPMLRVMATPEEVIPEATTYLRIYFAGISGLLIYNIGSGVLRAVGNTVLPLGFLILTSLLNIVLDLLFVLVFHMGIAGVALATILSQMVSAVLIMMLLTRTKEVYRFRWNEMKLDMRTLKRIFGVGLPAGIQSVITAFSNVFVQSYINYFGAACMAGWGCYNKLDQFIMLPISSIALAATTFVSQNIGAGQPKRANEGTRTAILTTLSVTLVIVTLLYVFAEPAVRWFTQDDEVVSFGLLFIHTNFFFFLFNCVNHVLAGALRGRGDSRGPMIIMLATFVGLRQIYLFVIKNYVSNTAMLIGFGYPVGWMSCCVVELTYFWLRWLKNGKISAT